MITPKKLAIIGASYLQLPLVHKAKEMGIETHCFAWADSAVCIDVADAFYPISITEKEKILQKCQEIGIDGITSIASDLAVPTVNYVASRMGLEGNNETFSMIQTDKYMMREALAVLDRDAKLSTLQAKSFIPQYHRLTIDSQTASPSFGFPQIVKPVDRSGSRGVTLVSNSDERQSAIDRAFSESFSKEIIIEEYIAGSEVSVESISHNGEHYVLQITDKVTTGSPYFVELEHHQPSMLPEEIKNKILAVVPKALDALHITTGASHTEIKIDPEGNIRIIEIGARMGGDFIGSHLVELSTGYDFLRGVIECALNDFHMPQITKNLCSGVYFLSLETPNIIDYIKHVDKYPDIVKSEITDPALRCIKCSADRSGYFIYQSNKKFEL